MTLRGAMRQSIESLDRMVLMVIDNDNRAYKKYWERRWKPDFPDGVNNFYEFEDWFNDLVNKAKKMAHKKLLVDIIDTLVPSYYHVARRENIGIVFEADGVNANPACITLPVFRIEFIGEYLGTNIADDGVVVKPTKIISVEGSGNNKKNVQMLEKQIEKYYD